MVFVQIAKEMKICEVYFEVTELGVVHLHLANVIEYNMICVWLFNIVMMYSSLLDCHSFCYVCFKEILHQRCFYKVLADVGYAIDTI